MTSAGPNTRDPARVSLPRVTTGVPGLDVITAGGLIDGNLYLIEGEAGSGKTVLGAQIAFHLARQSRRVLFATLIAETHGKLLNHLRGFSFFDESLFPDPILLVSAYEALLREGLDGMFRHLASAIAQHRPSLLVIDGFRAVRDVDSVAPDASQPSIARFIHELGALLSAARCTGLLLAPHRAAANEPEYTLVDGLIELGGRDVLMRRTREIHVRKLRAAEQIPGYHMFRITPDGVRIFPRLEALATAHPPIPPDSTRRVPFAVESLNQMIGGGLIAGSTTSLIGAPGAGKTLLGLHFLEAGTRLGEPVLYLGFFEPPSRLLSKARSVSLDLAAARERGLLELLWHPPLEYYIDELAEALLENVRRRKIQRLFIDGIGGFRQSATYPERLNRFLAALANELRTLEVTTLLAEELPMFSDSLAAGDLQLSAIVENMILLRYVEIRSHLHRLISIVKMRESDFDSSIREFSITDRGIGVASTFESAEYLLTGHAHVVSSGDAARSPSRPRRKRP